MYWYLEALKKYATFSGRAGRAEYWMFSMISMGISIVLAGVDVGLGILAGNYVGALTFVYGVGILLPSIAVTARRMQDTGKPFWWILISLVPVVGTFALIYFLAKDGEPGTNAFGANPEGGSRAVPAMAKAA